MTFFRLVSVSQGYTVYREGLVAGVCPFNTDRGDKPYTASTDGAEESTEYMS
jgi:hypothetical protein